MEWLDIIQRPIDWILSDLDPRSRLLLNVKVKIIFTNNSIWNCLSESPQN